MSRRTRVGYALAAGVMVALLGLSVLARDVHASLAWLVALCLLAIAVLNHRDAITAANTVDHLRACLAYAREERDDARTQLRRAHMRLDSAGLRWADTRVNGGRPITTDQEVPHA